MLRILPVQSPLHSPQALQMILEQAGNVLDDCSIQYSFVEDGDAVDPQSPTVIFVLTGGCENQVLDLVFAEQDSRFSFQKPDEPVIVLAHPFHNSFPACTEILARLEQKNKKAKIVLLNDTEHAKQSLKTTAGVLSARQKMEATRLGLIGGSSSWLVASNVMSETIKEHWKVDLVDIPMEELEAELEAVSQEEARPVAQSFAGNAVNNVEPTSEDILESARIYVALKKMVARHSLDALSLRCFDLVMKNKSTGCLALSMLTDEGIIAGCEGDIPATLTMQWLHAVTGQVPFMANPQDIDVDANSLWIAICTIGTKLCTEYSLRSHFESSLGVGIEGQVETGPITLARIGGSDLLSTFVSDGTLLECGTHPQRCRTQLKLELDEDVSYFVERPLGNHHVLVLGQYEDALALYAQLYLNGRQL